jgi:hypothetical protein
MVRFKIGFTIGAETLFGLMSKMLPIEDLSVEELVERQPIARMVIKGRRGTKPDLNHGINAILLAEMANGPMRAAELEKSLVAAGFSANSVGSRLSKLREQGVVEQIGDGTWRRK